VAATSDLGGDHLHGGEESGQLQLKWDGVAQFKVRRFNPEVGDRHLGAGIALTQERPNLGASQLNPTNAPPTAPAARRV
jgi:hypothetical protein